MIGKADLGNLRRLWPIVRGQKWALAGVIALALVGTVEGLLWPLVTRFVIDVCTVPPAAYVCVTPDVVVCAYPNLQFICIPAETPVKPPCNPPYPWF